MKKFVAILLAAVLALSLCACGQEPALEPGAPENGGSEAGASQEESAAGSEREQEEPFAPVKMIEPELIAEHVAALNMVAQENFGTEYYVGKNYVRLYKDAPPEDSMAQPDAVIPSKELPAECYNEGKYNEYYVDRLGESCYEVTNFSSKAEVYDYLSRWLAPEIFNPGRPLYDIDESLFDFDGKLYYIRFQRGYGVKSYGNTEIVSQTETKMIAVTHIYALEYLEEGTAELKFEKRDGKWIMVSVEDRYYE